MVFRNNLYSEKEFIFIIIGCFQYFKALPLINLLVVCDVTKAWIVWKTFVVSSYLQPSSLQSTTLQLSTRDNGFMNVTNDIIARHFQDVNIYEVTKLQSNTKYQFRVVTFDCDDVVISSGHLTCHTRPVIDKSKIHVYTVCVLIFKKSVWYNRDIKQIIFV